MESTTYQLNYVRVGSTDLQRSKEFYGEVLGLPIITENIKRGYLLFEMSGVTLIVERSTPEDPELPPNRYLGISIKVRNINEFYKALTAQGVVFSQPPEKQFWGGYLTEFEDPDGNVWTLLG